MPATDFNHGTRVLFPNINKRPVQLANMRAIGAMLVADDSTLPLNEPVSFFSDDAAFRAKVGTAGNSADIFDAVDDQGVVCEMVVVRVAQGTGANPAAILENTLQNIVGAGGSSMTGVHALKGAQSHTGVKPHLLIAPGYTDMRVSNAANPVVAELGGIATRLKGPIVADADASSNAAANTWATDFANNKHVYAVTPMGKVFEGATYVNRPLSGRVAALFNKKWKARGGPWFSPSNQIIGGIGGISRPISYYDGELDHDANYLNARGLATVIDGNTLWGNRTLATDTNDIFVNIVLTKYAIAESIVKAFRAFMDENLGKHLGVAIAESLNDFGSQLLASGAVIAKPEIVFDPDQNNAADLTLGRLRYDIYGQPSPPLEDLIFAFHHDPSQFDLLVEQIAQGVASLTRFASN